MASSKLTVHPLSIEVEDDKIAQGNQASRPSSKHIKPSQFSIYDYRTIVDVFTFEWLKDSDNCNWDNDLDKPADANPDKPADAYLEKRANIVTEESTDFDFYLNQLQGFKQSYINQYTNTGGNNFISRRDQK
jgi:hypothetical protein